METFNSKPVESPFDQSQSAPEDIISRDVCVIGGGASGNPTAIRLKDNEKSIVVLEAKSRLGGHAETYKDPDTGTTLDVGVTVFGHLKKVKDLFARFNILLSNGEFVD